MAASTITFLSLRTSSTTLTTHSHVPGHLHRNPNTLISPDAHVFLTVDEYIVTPLSSMTNFGDKGLTLLFTHGTSFNKTLWRPTITKLLQISDKESANSRSKLKIKRILAIDASNHGESWTNNREVLSDVSYWPDQSRDILEVLSHFQVQQPVIGIGHSFGGGIMAHAALMSPSSFTATIFVDPILFKMAAQDKITADRALRRRDHWDSLDQVRKSFGENKGFKDWHPEVLALHADHGTVEVVPGSKASRVLSTPKEQEAATYLAGPFEQLPELLARSQGRHFFILGKKSVVIPQKDQEWIQRICTYPNRTVTMEEAGHLIPMQDPYGLAQKLYDILEEIWQPVALSHVRSSM